MPIKMKPAPIHCDAETASFKISTDKITVTGNSAVAKIVASPEPIFGIPMEKAIEGITILKVPKASAYFHRPFSSAPS